MARKAPARKTVLANGINGVTGDYDFDPIPLEELARVIRRTAPKEAASDHVLARKKRIAKRSSARALPWDVEAHDISRAGWGVVFSSAESHEVKAAVQPLLQHRARQVGGGVGVKELVYLPSEDATEWLARHEVSWHNVEPTRIPYYLLWVGSLRQMPLEVIHEIDSDYCVGILDFDTPAEYSRYVKSVIEYETASAVRNTREAVFFGTRHAFDDATKLSADWLVTPLADGMPADGPTPAERSVPDRLGFRKRKIVGDPATRQSLVQLLEGAHSTPSFLFTASHGMVWPNGDPHQFGAQGALLCQDWPGFGGVTSQHYFGADDVPDTARVHGMITFHFACYGAGTPRESSYAFEKGKAPPAIAPRPFLAALPRRLLSHPRGGILGCIGHIERAWGSSITGITERPQIRQFQNAIARILLGKPLGLAVQEFNDLSATLSNGLADMLGRDYKGLSIDDVKLATTWLQRNDAGGFVLLGDPAVRLRVGDLL